MLRLLLFAALVGRVVALIRPGTVAKPYRIRLQDSAMSNNQFRSFLYDPIMNDPQLKARYSDEMLTVKDFDEDAVRKELLLLNNNSTILLNKDFDQVSKKEELDHLLARLRVKQWLAEQESRSGRADKAQAIGEEKAKVQLLGDKEVISELRARRVQFSPLAEREQLDSLLAISRLSFVAPVGESKGDIAKKWMDKATDLKTSIESKLKQPLVDDNDKKGSAAERARKVVDSLAMTDSERAASDLLRQKKKLVPAPSISPTTIEPEDLEAFELRLLSGCTSFDEIVSFCTREGCSRVFIAKMLIKNGVAVPKYAPLSALVNMLADQLLILKGGDRGEPEPRPRRAATSVKRISDYDEFALEKDLFAEAKRRIQSLMQAVLRSSFTLPTNSELRSGLAAVSRGVLSSKAFAAVRTALSLTAMFVAESALGAARWAGGATVLKPPQTLSLLCAYSLLTRSGVISFLLSFLVLRFVRVIVLSSDIDESEGKDQEISPQL